MAVLAAYMVQKGSDESFADFLNQKVFAGETGTVVSPDPEDVKGFDEYIESYKAAIKVQQAAIDALSL